MSEFFVFLGKIPFITSDWFYGLCALIWGFFIFIKGQREKIEADKDLALQQKIENNLRMRTEYRLFWTKFIALPEDSKEIFQMRYEQVQDENTRSNIHSIIAILHDVHVIHQMRGEDVSENMIWTGTFDHVFHEKKHKVFVDAFRKFCEDNQFSKEFVSYIEEIIKINNHSTDVEERKVS